jgi:homocysteine S-methyltransferase
VQPEQARAAFAEQIRALASAQVDLLIFETFADLYEIVEAIAAARETAPELPVIASMTFTRDNRTLLGDSPAKVARRIHQTGADVIGINCSGGPNQLLNILKRMREAVPEGAFSVMPNAGWPQQVEGRIMYPAGPEYFGDYALSFWREGACLIGGCCGTTPEHILSMSKAVETANPKEFERSRISVTGGETLKPEASQLPSTQLAQKLAQKKFVIAVEMDPPRGWPRKNCWQVPACFQKRARM